MKRALDWITTGLFFALALPLFLGPYAPMVRAMGRIGRTLLPLVPARRRIDRNIAHVRPEATPAEREAIVAGVGDNFARLMVEFFQFRTFGARRDLRRVSGLEHLHAAAAEGRGVILVSAHYGDWEAARFAARDAGIEVGLIYRAFNNTAFDGAIRRSIARAGRPVLHKGREGMKAMVRHIRQGGAMLILLDQRLGAGTMLPFLGRPAQTATAVAALAARTGAPMVPVVCRRRADGLSFDVIFEPQIPRGPADAMMGAVNARVEAWVDAAPEQWFWLHRRWKYAD